MPEHLPARRQTPAPAAPPGDLERTARRAGLEVPVVAVGAECFLCGTDRSPRWTEAALDGYGHRFGQTGALVVGWCCLDCLPAAEARVEDSQREAQRASMRPLAP
jgi:hypothetical protein